MIFRILLVNLEKIFYSFNFYQEIEDILDYGIEFISIEKSKSIDYLFASLQVTKNLSLELRENIIYRSLITEFREEYFINKFDQIFCSDLSIRIEFESLDNNYLSDHTDFSLESYYYTD
jgi:hypothetical protein